MGAASSPKAHSRTQRAKKRLSAAPKLPTAPTDELLKAGPDRSGEMLERLFCVVTEFGYAQGLSHQQVQKAFAGALRQLKRLPYQTTVTARFRTLQQIAALLESWYVDAAFLDESGRPKPLPITGIKSFSTLAGQFLPEYPHEQLAEMMIRERLLNRSGGGFVVPHRRAAAFKKPNAMMLDRIPVLVHGLLSSFAHNTSPKRRTQGTRCERNSFATVPIELLPAFNEIVKVWAQSLLDKVDAWARRRGRSAHQEGASRVVRVGVEVFAFLESDARTMCTSRKRRS